MYRLDGRVAAPRVKVGADVLPWWPARGVYLLVERGDASASTLTEVPGVAGAWWGAGVHLGMPYSTADNEGLQITYCFLDDDPVDAAERLRPVLQERWADAAIAPLLAAPFHPIVPLRVGVGTCPDDPSLAAALFVGQNEVGVAGLDHPAEAVAPVDLGAAEDLVHVGDVGPQRRVRVGRVLEDRLDADELPRYAQ